MDIGCLHPDEHMQVQMSLTDNEDAKHPSLYVRHSRESVRGGASLVVFDHS